MSNSKPFYQTKSFLNSIFIMLFITVVVYTVFKLEDRVVESLEHDNFGYTQVSAIKEIGAINALTTKEFVVNIDRDTILRSYDGIVIKIPAGSLESANKTVVLLVKEAYDMYDMIRGGLTTKFGKDLLSSGGMFYIQAKDSMHVKIVKPLSIYVPTDEVNPEMKLFTGETAPLGKIDWQDPVDLKSDTTKVISAGEQLFKENCKSCHALGKESVGPDLAYIGRRRDFDWIKRFTQNPALMIANKKMLGVTTTTVNGDTTNITEEYDIQYNGDQYAACLYEKYNKAEMTAFPIFEDKDIIAICDYCTDESKRLNLPYPKDELYVNFQKCKTYKALMSKLYAQKSVLKSKRKDNVVDNGSFVKQVDRSMQVLQLPDNAASMRRSDRTSYVYPANQKAAYYQVEITTFGWYNIDVLVKNGTDVVNSKVFVEVSDSFSNTFQIYLVLPAAKVYGAGGLLRNKKDVYGFYEDNGKIKLPQGQTAHVYLVGEKDGQLIYAATTFLTDTLNKLRLNPVLISKETFNVRIKDLLQTEGMSVNAKNSKNAGTLRAIDSDVNALEEKIKEAEKLAPKDCDCGCVREEDDAQK